MKRDLARPLARFSLASFVAALCFSTAAACGGAQPAVAEPRKSETPDAPLFAGAVEADADLARAIREHYTKYEYRIPMRDGVHLYTVAYVPKDASRAWPIMLTRTPYAVLPYGSDTYPTEKDPRRLRRFAPSAQMVRDGFVFVQQDVRGRMMSEGSFVDIRPVAPRNGKAPATIDEATDAWDTIDFLVKNVPNNNGKVGVWGISYPGFFAAQSAIDAHPALKAVSPQAPVTEWFLGDDFHHNGALFLADAFDFYANFGQPRPEPTKKLEWKSHHENVDVYDFFLDLGPVANAEKYMKGEVGFWKDLMTHPNRDAFWKARDPRPHYRDSKPAIMTVGGFYDAEDTFGALETYRSFEKGGPRAENVLVMGPWRHGGWSRGDGDRLGDIAFGQKTSLFYREQIELPFFARHLKGRKAAAAPEAYVFETGTNEWHRHAQWPPAEVKAATLFFHPGGRLSAATPSPVEVKPAKDWTANELAFDTYVSDPSKPVPYRAKSADAIDAEYMIDDQRFAARRPDVLVYATDTLGADVALAGPIEASLWIATTGTDADFVVKVIDVFPSDTPDPEPNPTNVHLGGYQSLVRAEIMRAKFRASMEEPQPLKPNEPTLVRFTLPDVAHAFRAGHKIMVQIQSSWFPLADRNPQIFTDINKASAADFHVATHRVFHSAALPSAIKLTVSRGALPGAVSGVR